MLDLGFRMLRKSGCTVRLYSTAVQYDRTRTVQYSCTVRLCRLVLTTVVSTAVPVLVRLYVYSTGPLKYDCTAVPVQYDCTVLYAGIT